MGLLQLLVIINYLVFFIEYAYQTLVVYPMLYRYHLILLLYFVILLYCVYTLHIVPIYLIIVMILPLMGPWLEINTFVLYCIVYCQRHLKHIFVFYVSDTANLKVPNQIRMSMVEKLLWNSWCITNRNYSAILATLQITLYVGGG